jgi:hypothetical protein
MVHTKAAIAAIGVRMTAAIAVDEAAVEVVASNHAAHKSPKSSHGYFAMVPRARNFRCVLMDTPTFKRSSTIASSSP